MGELGGPREGVSSLSSRAPAVSVLDPTGHVRYQPEWSSTAYSINLYSPCHTKPHPNRWERNVSADAGLDSCRTADLTFVPSSAAVLLRLNLPEQVSTTSDLLVVRQS